MSILLLESIHTDAHQALAEQATVWEGVPEGIQPEYVDLAQVEAIITRGRGQVTAAFIRACPKLKAVARCGAGLDNVDVETAALLGIPVVYAPGKTRFAVAEHVLLFMLSLARKLTSLHDAVRSGQWQARASYQGSELRGKTLGIIGMGSIGAQTAALANAFGMDVIYWNRSPRTTSYTQVTLKEAFSRSDFLSLHLALTPETRHLMNEERLKLLKPSTFLINTARGGLVDETALLAALQSNQLAGYAADLLEQDPPAPTNPLLSHPKTLITPHSAVLTDVTYRDICLSTVQNVLAVLNGDTPDPHSIVS